MEDVYIREQKNKKLNFDENIDDKENEALLL
jgi:hypothetical protein